MATILFTGEMSWSVRPKRHWWCFLGIDESDPVVLLKELVFSLLISYDDGIPWNRFPYYWLFVRGNNLSLVDYPNKWAVMRGFDVLLGVTMDKVVNMQ